MLRRRRYLRPSLLIAAALSIPNAAAAGTETVTVFAAASLTDVVGTIATAFTEDTGIAVTTSFAASSTLARQIEAGAPADIYVSADTVWMDRLAARDLIDPETRRVAAGNRLVVIVPADSAEPPPEPTAPSATAGDLSHVLGERGRLAIADPAHVPAGRYAEAALTAMGLWADLADRLAPAPDVRAAVVLVARGEAPAGIVYATDAQAVDAVVVRWPVPEPAQPPIRYPAAIVAGRDGPAVRAFLDHLTGAEGSAVFARFGFLPP